MPEEKKLDFLVGVECPECGCFINVDKNSLKVNWLKKEIRLVAMCEICSCDIDRKVM